jgi:ABC-type nitrate/sulfonate/bicarbonate transport system substrate-binding protein
MNAVHSADDQFALDFAADDSHHRHTMTQLKVGAVSRNYFNMPLWIAKDEGFFERKWLDVSIELYEPIDEVTSRLMDGRLQLSLGVTEHVILGSEKGSDLQIIGGNVNRLPFSFIARPHVKTFTDLKGGVVGVSSLDAGSSSLVMKILSAHGLQYPGDYEIVACGPILARWEMLQQGKIDAGLQGIPLNYIALDQGYGSLCEPRDEFPWFQFTSLNVMGDWAESHKNETVAFMRAYIQAHEWFYANKTASRDIAVRHCGISADYADRAWDEYTRDEIFPRDASANPKSIQALIDISALIRALPGRAKTDAEQYINPKYIDQARTELAAAKGVRA